MSSTYKRKPVNISALVRIVGLDGQGGSGKRNDKVIKKISIEKISIENLEKISIEKLKEVSIEKVNNEKVECCICANDLDEPYMLDYQHDQFHKECLLQMFNPECPLCRAPNNLKVTGILDQTFSLSEFLSRLSAMGLNLPNSNNNY